MKKINKKVDGILAPSEVQGTTNLSYEDSLGLVLAFLVALGFIGLLLL